MQTDSQLIRKIKRKQDRDAADELVGRYYRDIYAFAYRQTGERELAMDLTQEIFIAILQGLDSFNEKKAQFRTWAYRVAANRITDYYRSRAHRHRLMELPLDCIAQNGESGRVPVAAEGADGSGRLSDGEADAFRDEVLDKILNKELVCRTMEFIAGYDAQWVAIFQYRCFEEMTFAEIAKALALSENTVKTRYYSMVRSLRKAVMEHDGTV